MKWSSSVFLVTPTLEKHDIWRHTNRPWQRSLPHGTMPLKPHFQTGNFSACSRRRPHNIIIPSATNWGPQDIWGRFKITDSNGVPTVRLDSDDVITISFVETPNAAPCPAPNPNGSTCDDFFTFTAIGLNDLFFNAKDGSNWMAQFRLANLVDAIQIGNTIYTAEAQSSHLDVQVLVSQVPEPTTLTLFGLGLLGLGLARRRQLKG